MALVAQTDRFGRYAAMAFGFMNMVGNIGNFVAPITNERLFNLYGWNALFTVNAIILVAATVFWFFNDPHKRFYPDLTTAALQGLEPVMAQAQSNCPSCKQAVPASVKDCPYCGYMLIPPRP